MRRHHRTRTSIAAAQLPPSRAPASPRRAASPPSQFASGLTAASRHMPLQATRKLSAVPHPRREPLHHSRSRPRATRGLGQRATAPPRIQPRELRIQPRELRPLLFLPPRQPDLAATSFSPASAPLKRPDLAADSSSPASARLQRGRRARVKKNRADGEKTALRWDGPRPPYSVG